ncbi:glycoside hydrolase family 108 protein [Pedomonas mirosovicensis]|uniref:glycoside hydrolase family 108 protein n=1 Tax=Pedomonas mirosovicensis TaxID=2908641 RepID=UPI002168664D|nr:glycosyl hydrolase 108 family protein [Pedomonas mirosovicensis]MCH8684629.1 hypothetical protein [Pedomonas mirosovicensis]
MTVFERLMANLLRREGGYVYHRDDRGGETNFGITEAVARQYGYDGPMQAMPEAVAMEIYRQRYWVAPGFERVAGLSVPVAEELFDTGVNMGPMVAGRFLQRALNALNRQERDFPDVLVDGAIGPQTLTALSRYLLVRGREGEAVLLTALSCLKGERYISLAEQRGANESFVYGWLRTRVGIGEQVSRLT